MASAVHQTPGQLSRALVAAVNAGDLARALACFSPRAGLMTPGETILEGREAIGELLAQMISMKVAIQAETRRLVQLGDQAFLTETWSMRNGEIASHSAFEQTTRVLALHRQVEREGWKFIFLAPWGFD